VLGRATLIDVAYAISSVDPYANLEKLIAQGLHDRSLDGVGEHIRSLLAAGLHDRNLTASGVHDGS
jgi:hypothetical protein